MKSRLLIVGLMFAISLSASGCASIQNTGQRNLLNWSNKSATVECFSGGQSIYKTRTDGKVTDSPNSDGFFFTKDNGDFVEINADCVVTYDR